MYDLVCSLVIYKNEKSQLLDAIHSFLNTSLRVKLILVDNSPTDVLKDLIFDERCEYVHNPTNPGYGTSHNVGINKYILNTKYYLILNPDIYFDKGVIEDLFDYMNMNIEVGLVMPKVLYPNGEIQYLAKLLPTPFTFFTRRFIPFRNLKKVISDKFELRFSGYNTNMEAPYLSGCFMFFRSLVLKEINGFDENIFMHMEDLDISRRCYKAGYKTIYYPYQVVYHDHKYKTFLTFTNLKMYFASAIYYFNKWGWFLDKERREINKKIVKQIIENKK